MKLSTALANALMVTGSLKDLLDGGKIYVYSGDVPSTADAALDGNTLLLTVASGSSGLTFESTASNGVLTKTAAETWSGDVASTGTAAFFRFCVGSDDGSEAAGASDYRVQGTIGVDATFDMQVTSTTYTEDDTRTVDIFQIYLPVAG